MFPIIGNGIGPGGNALGRTNILRYQRTANRNPPRIAVSTIILKSTKNQLFIYVMHDKHETGRFLKRKDRTKKLCLKIP